MVHCLWNTRGVSCRPIQLTHYTNNNNGRFTKRLWPILCGRYRLCLWPIWSSMWPTWLWPRWYVADINVIQTCHLFDKFLCVTATVRISLAIGLGWVVGWGLGLGIRLSLGLVLGYLTLALRTTVWLMSLYKWRNSAWC